MRVRRLTKCRLTIPIITNTMRANPTCNTLMRVLLIGNDAFPN